MTQRISGDRQQYLRRNVLLRLHAANRMHERGVSSSSASKQPDNPGEVVDVGDEIQAVAGCPFVLCRVANVQGKDKSPERQ